MVVNCREMLSGGARRVARGLRHHRSRGPHAHRPAHGTAAARPAPASPPACSDTDAPFRALRRPAAPAQGGPGTLGKAAGVAAATAAAGTGAGLGYRSLVGAPLRSSGPGFGPGAVPGVGSRGVSPDLAQADLAQTLAPQPASSAVPSFAPLPGTNDTPPFLPVSGVTPPGAVPGATPTAVPEPASALILGMALLAFALTRGRKRGGSGRAGPGGAATGRRS